MTPHPLADHRLPHLDRDPTAGAWCEECGAGWSELPDDAVVTIPGCGFEGYYGPQEDSYTTVCPACDCNRDPVVVAPRWLYRARKRRRLSLHLQPQAA